MLAAGAFFLWGPIVIPTLAVIVGGVGVYAGGHSFMKERQEREGRLEEHADRFENAVDLVLGRQADPYRGVKAVKSLEQRLDEQDERLEQIKQWLGINGHPRPDTTILQMLQDLRAEGEALCRKVDDVVEETRRKGLL